MRSSNQLSGIGSVIGIATIDGKRWIGRLVGTLIGIVGFGVGLRVPMVGLVGALVGLGCTAIGWTGGLMGIVGIEKPGEISTGGLTISGLIARARMEASFAMATLKKKRTANVKIRCNLRNVFMMADVLK